MGVVQEARAAASHATCVEDGRPAGPVGRPVVGRQAVEAGPQAAGQPAEKEGSHQCHRLKVQNVVVWRGGVCKV